ncbi:omptin family outer membrane protease [Providencia alcalifaciens]|uniref:omptin family outer membrane protease n=1 Tax=Providencia alcalifaciens TaxID=126385 RepID=UPI0015CFAC1D|nr:omptin family outer membrane protease [Providencia alcalifaciens]MBF0693370.1 omptin family outer membrane protease [Providencia alcalifaciens]NYS91874.1 omptin family outer membrane protease [Providencia alcalifaciens]
MNKYIIALSILGLSVTNATQAQNEKEPYAVNFAADSITVNTSLGWLGGESKEYVYDPDSGKKLSELNWKINNAPIIKGDISWDPLFWLTLNARGWITLSSSGSEMDDYDWMDDSQSHWSDWSNSPDTHLNHANEFDINAKTWLVKRPDYKVGAVVGYQQTRFSWTAFGGHFVYDNGNNIGDFPPGIRGIGYKQKFSVPYIGLTGGYRYRDIEFNALLKFSPWVEARDNDEHYMNNRTFREKTSGSNYYSTSVDVGYYITPNAKVFTEFTWNKYSQGKGGMQVIDPVIGSRYVGGDAAGIENKNYSLTAGLQYHF